MVEPSGLRMTTEPCICGIGDVGQVDTLALCDAELERASWSAARRLMPTCLSSERFTSAMRTLRLTCSGVAERRRLTTCVPSPT